MLDQFFFTKHVDDDEEIVRIVHAHWLVGMRRLLWPTVCFIVAWGVFYAVPFLPVALAVALASVMILVWWIRNFFDYFLDAWIITDHGIIDIAWHGWFHRESSRILYSYVQGVSYEIQGIWATLIGFGTISIEKISTGASVSLDYVPRPRSIEKDILKRMEAYLHSKNLKDATHVQSILAEIVAGQVQIRGMESDDE